MQELRSTEENANVIGWRLPALTVATAMALLGGAILAAYGSLRPLLRNQLASRDAELLAAILDRQVEASATKSGNEWLLAVVEASVEASSSMQVESLSLYDTEGGYFTSIAGTNDVQVLEPALRSRLEKQHAAWDFVKTAQLSRLVVTMALREDPAAKPLAYARFALDGSGLASEFAQLDVNLGRQALATFVVAGGAMSVSLAWTFSQLRKAGLRLARETERLQEANRKLLLSAKTSAVGALASHLVHGLRNPVGALQQFVSALSKAEPASPDLADAAATAKRMKEMIDDVVRVLRDEHGLAAYSISAAELLKTLENRMAPLGIERSVAVAIHAETTAEIQHLEANVALLVLENLVVNAIDASPSGKTVSVRAALHQSCIEFTVSDQGPGLPQEVRKNLFSPVCSTKPGGSGLGLAISHQLARHLGGILELARVGETGSVFRLRMPLTSHQERIDAG
jgi:signal transduction histidine kinase